MYRKIRLLLREENGDKRNGTDTLMHFFDAANVGGERRGTVDGGQGSNTIIGATVKIRCRIDLSLSP